MSTPGDGFPDNATLPELLERVTPLTGVEHLDFFTKLVEATVPPPPTPVTLPVNLGEPPPSVFGANTRILKVVDGTQAAPLTGQDFYSPTMLIERWDASDITGLGALGHVAALQVEQGTVAPGMADVASEFIAIRGTASMYAVAPPGSLSAQVGIMGTAYVGATANHASAFGMGANAYIQAGSPTHAAAYGIEANVQNDAADATANPFDSSAILSAGVSVNSRGSKDDTVGVFVGAHGVGRWRTGLYISGIKPVTGIGIDLVETSTNFAPPIRFVNNNAVPCFLAKTSAFFQVHGTGGSAVLAIDCGTGQLYINDTTKAFPSGQAVTYGANDSGGAGFKLLRIPN